MDAKRICAMSLGRQREQSQQPGLQVPKPDSRRSSGKTASEGPQGITEPDQGMWA